MINLSVIIPSRQPEFLQKTIDDILAKSKLSIEVIVIFDGIWPKEMLREDDRVIILHHGTVHDSPGMRESINKGVSIARGNYIMKIDEHCMVSEGFDEEIDRVYKLEKTENWVIIPRRKRLDPEKWELINDGRPDIDYMYIEYPFLKPFDSTQGLHGNEWRQRFYDRKKPSIDLTPSMQGSCYIMRKDHWDKVIKKMETEKYGPFTQEAQEIGFKTWFSGGCVVVDKNIWYAHYHKGRKGKGYNFSNQQYEVFMETKEKGRQFSIDYWTTTKDYEHDWEWFMNLFPDMPGWEGNWKERLEQDRTKDFRFSPEFKTWSAEEAARKDREKEEV